MSELDKAIEIKRILTEFMECLEGKRIAICTRYDIDKGTPFSQVQYWPLTISEKHDLIMEFLKELGFKIPTEEETREMLKRRV